MREGSSRMTVPCPQCGRQVIVHVRFPRPEHLGSKQPVLESWVCTGGCTLSAEAIHRLIGV